jgi:hypothetical protein
MRAMRILLGCALILLVTGCGSIFDTNAEVESNTTWSGSFNGRTVDGSGNQTILLGKGSGAYCATVQKQTRSGFLTVTVSGHSNTTTADFGVVTVCN